MAEQYRTRSGAMQWKPTVGELESMEESDEGFCLACGEMVQTVEPDAVRYTCECCGKEKVYGWAELALMGLVAPDREATDD